MLRSIYKKSPYGRPSMAPGVYFRCLLIGYFEGLDSERGIAWRTTDSLSLRKFLGYAAGRGDAGPFHDFAHAPLCIGWRRTRPFSAGC